jgi:transcriptional regulator with XRE-family HTH domain
MEIKDRIKYVRGDLTQAEFAAKLSVSLGAVQHWEAGDQYPKGDILLRFYNVFKINVNWLLTGDGEPYLGYTKTEEKQTNAAEPEQTYNHNVITIEHKGLIERFKDKARAKNANYDLLDIEALDYATFIETVGYIRGIAEQLRRAARPADRRRGQRRSSQTDDQIPDGPDRRSGTDRRSN